MTTVHKNHNSGTADASHAKQYMVPIYVSLLKLYLQQLLNPLTERLRNIFKKCAIFLSTLRKAFFSMPFPKYTVIITSRYVEIIRTARFYVVVNLVAVLVVVTSVR